MFRPIPSLVLVALALSPAPAQTSAQWSLATQFRLGVDSPSMTKGFEAARVSKSYLATQQFGRYYIARYYHRKYEWALNDYDFKENPADLHTAYKHYHFYTDESAWKGAKSSWRSDALFYKAIYYLERNSVSDALRNINRLDPKLDSSVYIDEIVWTRKGQFVVRQTVPTGRLQREMLRILAKYDGKSFGDALAESVARDLCAVLTKAAAAR